MNMLVGFRPKRLAELSQMQVSEDSCTLCFDNRANVTLMPCTHRYNFLRRVQRSLTGLQIICGSSSVSVGLSQDINVWYYVEVA